MNIFRKIHIGCKSIKKRMKMIITDAGLVMALSECEGGVGSWPGHSGAGSISYHAW